VSALPPNGRFVPGQLPPASAAPALWFVFSGERLLYSNEGSDPGNARPLPRAVALLDLGLEPLAQHYLGALEGTEDAPVPCFAAEIAPDAPLPPGFAADGLRQLYPVLGEDGFALAGRAVQVVEWARTHRFCGHCGAPTVPVPGERAMRCPACGLSSYPRLAPAIIIAVVRRTGEGPRLLLARNHRFPPGRYSVVAGFVEPGESLEECAQREVLEEVGIRIANLRYFGSQPWPFPHSLMVAFTAEYAGGEIALDDGEIAEAGWFAADALPQLPPRMSIARRLIDWFVYSQPRSR
jgi:NAD+ diphosphatase